MPEEQCNMCSNTGVAKIKIQLSLLEEHICIGGHGNNIVSKMNYEDEL